MIYELDTMHMTVRRGGEKTKLTEEDMVVLMTKFALRCDDTKVADRVEKVLNYWQEQSEGKHD